MSTFSHAMILYIVLCGFAKQNKFQKSELPMKVGGWVQVTLNFVFLENHPKIAPNKY